MSPATCGILTVSDSCYRGEKIDAAGPKLQDLIKSSFPQFEIKFTSIVPDQKHHIIETLNVWIKAKCNLILTTGGTGFSPRDVTPEATKAVIDREAPGIIFAMISKSLAVTPMAMLSRAVCGIRDRSIIINLPGSTKGAAECFGFIQECIPHAIAVVMDQQEIVTEDHKKIQQEIAPNHSKVTTRNVADRPRQSTYPMVEVEDAVKLVMEVSSAALPQSTEEIPIEDGLFRVLAEDVLSPHDVPPCPTSIKDGYAVRASDTSQHRQIVASSTAGDSPLVESPLLPGQAVRISTGAPIPLGADAVVQVEDTSLSLKTSNNEELEIEIHKIPKVGQDIRVKGCDISKDAVVLKKGVRLKASHIGILATVGKSRIEVFRTKSVGILTTGNELVEHYEEMKLGQIRDSNRITLINLLRQYNYTSNDYGIIRDNPTSIKTAMSKALSQNDILITTGGVSMGEHDYIKTVLSEDFQAKIWFGRINMKPGKPTTFASLTFEGKQKLVFGLPGNPVSATVTCLLFIVPLLRKLEGCDRWKLPTFPYRTPKPLPNNSEDDRPEYARAKVTFDGVNLLATPVGPQHSSRLASMVEANGLLLRHSGKAGGLPGEMTLTLLDDLELH